MTRTKSCPIKLKNSDKLTSRKTSKRKHVDILPVIQHPNLEQEQYYLGDICIGKSHNMFPETWNKCKIGMIKTQPLAIKLIFDTDTLVLVTVLEEFILTKEIFTTKVFSMHFYKEEDKVFIKLFLCSVPLLKLNKPIMKAIQFIFWKIFQIENNGFQHSPIQLTENSEIIQLYKNIQQIQSENVTLPNSNVQHPLLIPKLRPYQESAVQWMIMRETDKIDIEMLHPLYVEILLKTGQTIYYNKYTSNIEKEKPLVLNVSSGGILADEMGLGKTVEVLACILLNKKQCDMSPTTTDSTLKSPTISKETRVKKRKLSDEIASCSYVVQPKKSKVPLEWVKGESKKTTTRLSLEKWYQESLDKIAIKPTSKIKIPELHCICGETEVKEEVECIDCKKLQHGNCLGYKQKYGVYRCPQCWINQPLLECKGTLIICPLTLRDQWCDEICKHIGDSLKVLIYEGARATAIYPSKLKEYDLVLTTYNILQTELRLSETGQILTLRKEPRYGPLGSPLTLVKWWRLCLDEAQTVEMPNCIISTMAKKLHAHHRWAVTGTPISRDISGLFGLINYLQIEPYGQFDIWNYLLYLPYLSGNSQPMLKFLSEVMWRSSKIDVIEQIDIPPQTVKEHILEFSAVEKFYYEREHELCTEHFLNKLRNYDVNVLVSTLNKSDLKKIMAPLFTIRQACSHPNATRGRYLATRKQVTSMENLLNALIEKNITESDELLRMVVSALNGLAGIYLLLQNPEEAVAEYRKVMQLAARFDTSDSKKCVIVDKLQLIHTVHNLAEVLEHTPFVPPTLRDSNLKQYTRELQETYVEKYISQTTTSYQEAKTATQAVETLEKKYTAAQNEWYPALLEWIVVNGILNDLFSRINMVLENANHAKIYISSERKLLYLLSTWTDNISDSRETTIMLLQTMYTTAESDKIEISEGLVKAAMDCHLRPHQKLKNNKKCLVCEVSIQMRKYESILFDMTKSSEEDLSNRGSWKPTSEELILKALYNYGKSKNVDNEIIKSGELYLSMLDATKKEFRILRKFWTYLHQQISAYDEIEICKTRLRLKQPGEDEKKSPTNNVLKQLSNVLENKVEFINYMEERELNYQMAILKSEEQQNMLALERNLGTHSYLETLRNQQFNGQNPDPCPICKNVLQDQWSILPCGHCYCLECIQILLEKTNANRIACSICRQYQNIEDVSYIKTNEENDDQDSFIIKGNYSTKAEAIVKLILQLRNENRNVKILVFSTWPSVLKILKTAFTKNKIVNELMLQHSTANCLKKFKTGNVTALLLPISLGSKGLNLIEATHVILVEPLLNPGDELQAIGRVHRIGQTRPTTIHKFIVKNTIEESLHQAISTNTENWDKNKIVLKQLQNLFIGESNIQNQNINNLSLSNHSIENETDEESTHEETFETSEL